MSHFSGYFEGASTFLTPFCARDNLRGQKSLGPLKMSLEMAHKVIVPQKKIMSRSFLNSGTLIIIASQLISNQTPSPSPSLWDDFVSGG
jgi:hypothetical protein